MPPEKIHVHWTYSGGGFGRRLLADFVAQAVVLSKAVQRPVKVVWTREQDMTHDFYRPATLTRIAAALDAQGMPTAIAARLVSATQLALVSPAPLPANVDPRCTEGLEETRYGVANFRLDYNKPELAVPTSVLRTTGFGPNIFALETFIDELAHAAGADPYGYRRALLQHDARALKVLDLAAERSENLQGGAIWGLTSAMKSEITFAKGGTVQENFGDYDVVHLWEAPAINEVHLLEGNRDSPGEQKIGGLGEVGPTGIPPAFANALFAATGERLRTLPLLRHGYSFAQD
ncbi:MAG TPA: molybdopterin cofactor-binding domain-containing protein [Xanthobacteraceae bacterium]|nr:molybdopterin cofactor-binding domain-containing protein [Xanthobacteraceae bacterium]